MQRNCLGFRPWTLLLLTGFLVLSAVTGVAQDDPATTQPPAESSDTQERPADQQNPPDQSADQQNPPDQSADQQNPPNETADQQNGQAGPGSEDKEDPGQENGDVDTATIDPLIYVPYQNFAPIYGNYGIGALVPYAEYWKLLQYHEQQQKKAKPPVDALVQKATYTAIVKDKLAKVSVNLVVRSLAESWTRFPLAFGNAAVASWKSDNPEVAFRGSGDKQYELLLPQAGTYQLEFELAIPIQTNADVNTFSWNGPMVAISTLKLTIPETDREVKVGPTATRLTSEENNDTLTQTYQLGASNSIYVSWSAEKKSAQPQMDLLTSVTNDTLVRIEDQLVHTDAYLTYKVLRGELTEARLQVPTNQRILDLTANVRLKDWSVNEADGMQTLTVTPLSPVTDQLVVEIHTERPLTDDGLNYTGKSGAGIHALDIVRESGQLGIKHEASVTVNLKTREGLVRIDADEIHEKLKNANLVFKYYTTDYEAELNLQPVEPKVSVATAATFSFDRDELKLNASYAYLIERAGVFQFQIAVPEGVTIDLVNCNGLKDYDVTDGLLTVSLSQKQMGQVQVNVTGHFDLDESQDEQSLELPIPEPQDVERETGRILVYAPLSQEVLTDREEVVSAQPIPAGNVARAVGEKVLVSAWQYARRPVTIPVQTKRKPTRLLASTATTLNVEEELLRVTNLVNYTVEFAGIDTFVINVPAAVRDTVQVELVSAPQSAGVKQKAAGETTEQGWVPWTVVLQREVIGPVQIRVTYDVPILIGNNGESNAGTVDIAPAQPQSLSKEAGHTQDLDLSRANGELLVTKTRSLSVIATATGGDVEAIDVRQLTSLPAEGFAAFRYFQNSLTAPIVVTIRHQRLEILEVAETVINRALMEVILASDETARYRCRFRVKTSERQRLPLFLPDNSEPLLVVVGGREVQLEKSDANSPDGWNAFTFPVSRTAASDEEFLVTVHFLCPLNWAGGKQYWSGTLDIPWPRFSAEPTSNLVIQQQNCILWLPEEYVVVGNNAAYEAIRKPVLYPSLTEPIYYTSNYEDWDAWVRLDDQVWLDFPTSGSSYHYMNLGGDPELEIQWRHNDMYTAVISLAVAIVALLLRWTTWLNRLSMLVFAVLIATLAAQVNLEGTYHTISAARYGIVALLVLWLLDACWSCWRNCCCCLVPKAAPKPKVPLSQIAVVPPPGVFATGEATQGSATGEATQGSATGEATQGSATGEAAKSSATGEAAKSNTTEETSKPPEGDDKSS